MSKLLWVRGKNFCAGALFEKVDGAWRMVDCAPYLRRILRGVPVRQVGSYLRGKGYDYEWVKDRKPKEKIET